ncbi:MAG: class I SAM-dependent methyltransferase [Candidatus Doudnabacteria bacterium]|nr:class I SAM-dependent methyltransferase [Candidatus Doudnabacteria bacterium]
MLITILLLIIAASLAISVVSGAPFLPTHDTIVSKMVELAKNKPAALVADVGAGNGKILIALARQGITAHGYEINPWLWLWAKIKIWRAGVGDKAIIRLANFWSTDFSRYDTVIIFGLDKIMGGLETKLLKELKPHSLVISNIFQFPNWKGQKDGPLYVYRN